MGKLHNKVNPSNIKNTNLNWNQLRRSLSRGGGNASFNANIWLQEKLGINKFANYGSNFRKYMTKFKVKAIFERKTLKGFTLKQNRNQGDSCEMQEDDIISSSELQ